MPGRAGARSQPEAGAHEGHAEQHDGARPAPVHEPAEERTEKCRDEEPEREGAGGDAARPAELVEDRREQEREGGPRVDADAHGDERDRDD
jgi:hypothetical protein